MMTKSKIYLLLIIFVSIQECTSFKIHKLSRKRLPTFEIDDQFTNATILRTSRDMQLKLSNRTVKLLNVPDVLQATEYTCGPSSLSAVLNYYQLVYRETQLAKLAKTDQNYGTGPKNLLAAIRTLNISAQLKQGMLITDLQNSIDRGRPVIVQIQAWADQGTDYTNDYDDGHYVVVIGYDTSYLYFEDPWIINSIAYIPKIQFKTRWHDQVHSQQRRVYNLGIIVNAPLKNTPVIVKLE